MIKIKILFASKIVNKLTEHSQIELAQPSQPLGQSMSQGQPELKF